MGNAKLLAKARTSPHGWRRPALDRLLVSYGFRFREGGSHTVFSHPEYTDLVVTVPRHSPVLSCYVVQARTIIDTALDRQAHDDPP